MFKICAVISMLAFIYSYKIVKYFEDNFFMNNAYDLANVDEESQTFCFIDSFGLKYTLPLQSEMNIIDGKVSICYPRIDPESAWECPDDEEGLIRKSYKRKKRLLSTVSLIATIIFIILSSFN